MFQKMYGPHPANGLTIPMVVEDGLVVSAVRIAAAIVWATENGVENVDSEVGVWDVKFQRFASVRPNCGVTAEGLIDAVPLDYPCSLRGEYDVDSYVVATLVDWVRERGFALTREEAKHFLAMA